MSERNSGCGMIVGLILVVVVAIGGMFAVGWLYFEQTETQTQIIIDNEKVKTDTSNALEKGKEMVDQTKQGIEDATLEPEDKAEEAAEDTGSPNDES